MNPKKSIIVIALTVASLSISAHSNVCKYSINYNIEINQQQIKFDDKNNRSLIFTSDQLLIDGKPAELTEEQLKTSRAFQAETRKILPKVAEIAIEGAEIGVKAVTIVVTALFGADDEVHADLIQPIEAIAAKIKANVSQHSLNTRALEKSFDEEFEQQIESLMSKAISKYSGKIVGQILGSIFSGDSEELEDFEFSMENLEHDIEMYVETHAQALEIKAESLCEDFAIIAKLDKQLEVIEDYPENGVIQIGSRDGLQISGLNLNFD